MSAITAKASRKMKKYAVLTREPRCFLGSFDFSWEQRKLGELGTITTGNTPSTSIPDYYSDDGIVWVTPTDICENITFESARKLSDLGQQVGRVVPKNTILVTCIASIGKNTMLGNTGSFNQQINGLTPNENKYDPYFLLTESALWSAKMKGSAASGTMQIVNRTEFSELKTWLPSLIEQQAIGAFFKQLDNLITLHQRKCVFLFGFFQAFISMIFTASTFSWEQRKLGELVDRVVRKNTNNESTLPLTISAQYGLVDQITYFNNRVASRDVSNYYLVLNGEFAYNKSTSDGYPFGAVKRLDLYEKGVLSTLYIVFAPKKEQQIDSDYLTVFFDTDRWHKGVAERAAEGARNHGLLNISAEDFFDIDLSVPKDIVEQKQIGAFIRQLDNLITLHQRECISFTARAGRRILTANKKRNTSSWEQRKLSEIADKVTEKNAGLQYVETFTNSAEFGIISQRDFFDHDIAKLGSLDGYYIVKNEDFVYNPRISTSAPVGPINRNKLGRTGVMSPLYTVFRPHDVDTTYLEHFFKCAYWHSFMNFNGDSGARSDRFSIKDDVFFQMPIPLPYIDEQRKIGELLTRLDHLITLHQRKPFLMKWRTSDANRNKTNRLVL